MSKPTMARTSGPATIRALIVIGLTLLVALSSSAFASAPAFAGAHGSERNDSAHMARRLNASDTAHLHYIHSSGSELIETGAASGTLPGNMQAHVSIGATISGNFTIGIRGGGSISGHGTATPHGSGVYESFSGSLVVTGGTGRYAHAHGRAGLYGTFNRKTYALVVQTTGQLSY